MIAALVFAAAASMPSCWDLYDAALAHSARLPHPAYITYNQQIMIWQDGQSLLNTDQHIGYSDDGLARIEDARFNYHPMWTRLVEPGPPVLGPYGADREIWIATSERLPVIATTRAKGKVSCALREETYKGRDTYHLSFDGAPHLIGIWIDSTTLDIWKVEMLVPGYMGNDWDPSPDADYQIELGYHGPYLVVEHVTWNYQLREATQRSLVTGEYVMNDYAFPDAPKASADDAATGGRP